MALVYTSDVITGHWIIPKKIEKIEGISYILTKFSNQRLSKELNQQHN